MMTDLAAGMRDRGYAVTVLCSRNIMISGARHRDPIAGISVIRLMGTRFGKASNVGRLVDYLTFLFFACLRVPFLGRHDIVFVTTAPPMLGVLGVIIRWIFRSRFVYNIQDLYPHTAIQAGFVSNRTIIRFLHSLLRKILRAADVVVPIGEDIAERLRQDVSINRMTVIQNWAKGDTIFPVTTESNPLRSERALLGSFVVMYSGNFGVAHEFVTIITAAEMFKSDHGVVFLFIGDGVGRERIVQAVHDGDLPNVKVLPFLPEKDLASSLSACDVAIVTLARGMEGLIVPSKVYSSMAAGRAIIFIGHPSSTVAKLINAAECGIVIPNDDSIGLVDAIHKLRNDVSALTTMQSNARRYFEAHLDYPIAMERYDSLFKQLLRTNDQNHHRTDD